MKGWIEYKIEELCKVGRGSSPRPIDNPVYFEGGTIPWVKIADATASGKKIYSTKEYINEFGARYSRKLPVGSLILATSGVSLGQTKILGVEACIHDGWLYFDDFNDKLDKEYFYHRLLLLTDYLHGQSYGAAIQNVNTGILRAIKLKLPPLPTQRRIASILSAYDDLIENNLKRIKLLEELAQRTYEEWFVKFRIPVRHGGNGEPLPIDEKTGLPEGWEKKRLEDCILNYDNKRKPLAKLVREERKGSYPYYGAASIIDYIDGYIFDGRYLLIGEDGTVITPNGTAMLQFIQGKFWVSNHAHVITGNGNISTEFIYCFLNQYPISQHITGAAQPKISQMNLNRIELLIGTKLIMKHFDNLLLPLIEQIFIIKNQNQLLKNSRDILLPRLMSGKINVE